MKNHQQLKITLKDWTNFLIIIGVFAGITAIGAIVLLPDYWYVWIFITLAGVWLMVVWHAKNFAYICPKCGKVFEITPFIDFISPHAFTKYYLKCPKCKQRSWTEIISKR